MQGYSKNKFSTQLYRSGDMKPALLTTTSDKDKQKRLKANLANLAHEYSAIRQDRQRYPLRKEHIKALRELRENTDFVITRPDKGSGTVLLNKADKISKMMAIVGDKSKLKCLRSCDEHNRNGENERALQAFLLWPRNSCKISKDVYERIRPTGSVRPRMYRLPKVHKPEPIPLRPILSVVGSAQYELVRGWLRWCNLSLHGTRAPSSRTRLVSVRIYGSSDMSKRMHSCAHLMSSVYLLTSQLMKRLESFWTLCTART